MWNRLGRNRNNLVKKLQVVVRYPGNEWGALILKTVSRLFIARLQR